MMRRLYSTAAERSDRLRLIGVNLDQHDRVQHILLHTTAAQCGTDLFRLFAQDDSDVVLTTHKRRFWITPAVLERMNSLYVEKRPALRRAQHIIANGAAALA